MYKRQGLKPFKLSQNINQRNRFDELAFQSPWIDFVQYNARKDKGVVYLFVIDFFLQKRFEVVEHQIRRDDSKMVVVECIQERSECRGCLLYTSIQEDHNTDSI